ncbi:MAG: hypothetical protein AAFW81_11920 [Pseudomonadota bacterium]
MTGSDDYVRLAAALLVAALCIGAIVRPSAGLEAIERAQIAAAAIDTAIDGAPVSARACPPGEPALAGPFAAINDVLSVSPLGGITAPGEALPAPYIRINTRRADTAFERRATEALAPARADIVAIERMIERDAEGRAADVSWTVHFRSCETIEFYYGRLDSLDEKILRRAGDLAAFSELGGPDHLAIETSIRVQNGDVIGSADGFDVGLHDLAAAPAPLEAPERYRLNPFPRAAVLGAPASLIKAITPQTAMARCPIDYLPAGERDAWSALLGDSWGIRRARGENACREAVADAPGAARGVWFTDAAHNAAASKLSAVALSADAIDPARQIFALHGRLASLKPEMVALPPMMEAEAEEAAKDFLSFESGAGRINRPFEDVRDGKVFCYERLRANFVGPQINAVLLVQRETTDGGPAILKIEARGEARACEDLPEPWAFSGEQTVFYR